jgi:hypothetical protein
MSEIRPKRQFAAAQQAGTTAAAAKLDHDPAMPMA